jgi:hypothetical protein
MAARRLWILVGMSGVIAALVLAVTPLSYRSPEGVQKDVGFVESQAVDCGIALAPKNPTPPPGANEDCDKEHTRRGVTITGVLLFTFLVVMLIAFGPRLRKSGVGRGESLS